MMIASMDTHSRSVIIISHPASSLLTLSLLYSHPLTMSLLSSLFALLSFTVLTLLPPISPHLSSLSLSHFLLNTQHNTIQYALKLLVDLEINHKWAYITKADPVYRASKCAPSDMYRNGALELSEWIPQNIANGHLKEGSDFFLNLSDVKKFWRDNMKTSVRSPLAAVAAVPICLDITGVGGDDMPSSSSSSSSSSSTFDTAPPDFLKNIPKKKRMRLRKKLDLLIQEGEDVICTHSYGLFTSMLNPLWLNYPL